MRLLPILSIVALSVSAVPAFADQKDECEQQAAVVTRAAELRLEGKNQKKTVEQLQAGDPAVTEKYVPAVPHIVDWIYTLKRKEVRQDPGAAYLASCLAQ